ncbi:sulfate ABC transporter ATP-binding protein [Brevibacillus laterosporus]|nr:sulfate ABC transporter ATP-binding protein [Brevibacillus laterosporus]TPG70597.1 sulfate ABC transporter ATP-binding protein [Brevibacillus laterosporus]
MGIEIKQVSKSFGTFSALDYINLQIPSGKLVALLGPSGSGKTTLLRLIAGLEQMEQGIIRFDGVDATRKSVQERKVGFVFQHYALFRHMSVFDNIAFGLQVRPRGERPSKARIRAKVTELLRLVQLDGLESRFPGQLSGGQRQRVALARALAIEPNVLLLDEPFGALDAQVRQELRRWLKQLHHTLKITTVFVTHDQEEALEMADQVVIVNKGRIEQVGSPMEVYQNPSNPFVYNFLGRVNKFHVRVHGGTVQIGQLAWKSEEVLDWNHTEATGYIRPHQMEISRISKGDSWAEATLLHVSELGPLLRLDCQLKTDGTLFELELSGEQYRELWGDSPEHLYVNLSSIRLFPAQQFYQQPIKRMNAQSLSITMSEVKV